MNRRNFLEQSLALAAAGIAGTRLTAAEKAASPSSTAPRSVSAADHELHRGMSFGFGCKPGFYTSAAARRAIDDMAALGIRWVALHLTVVQDAFYSTSIRRDSAWTVGDGELKDIIAYCHSRGLKVMLKPMITCLDSAWQGSINFPREQELIQGVICDYWTPWFASFTAILTHYATLCEKAACEVYCAGCELVGTVERTANWRTLLASIRREYSGTVTFDTDHSILERTIPWFADLDFLSVSFYKPAADRPGATAEEMRRFLQPQVGRLRELAQNLGKPILFGECGCRSRVGAAMTPSDYRLPGVYGGEEQANFLDAICGAFWDEPWWLGLHWWKWDEQQHRPQFHTDSAGDLGFTVAGKPAAETMKRWYARPERRG